MIPLPHEIALMEGIPPGAMCELGAKRNSRGTYKSFFESCGFSHLSIDLNGTGDLALDLVQPIDVSRIGGPFDVVTNYGTTEHVDEQEPCWRNVHTLIRSGGYLISTTPLDWPRHGRWYPTEEWYRAFCALNGYEIEKFFVLTDRLSYHTACVRARKATDSPFVFPQERFIEMTDGKTGAYV